METVPQNVNAEGRAILAAIQDTEADAATACAAWTAHELVAHLAAGAKEVADLVIDKLEGRPERATRGFDEREAPFRALAHDELVEQLVIQSSRKLCAYNELGERSDRSIRFTGPDIDVDRLALHSRSEAAIHRWDLVGDDEMSRQLLAQPELTTHAVWVLDAMPVLDESAAAIAARAAEAGHPRATVTMRSDSEPDVVLRIDDGRARFEIVETAVVADVVMNTRADHRLLALWGRRPAAADADFAGDAELAGALHAILWPRAHPWR